ncbi:MAG: DUF5655 domain-containing protein [Bacteroidota bacterium]
MWECPVCNRQFQKNKQSHMCVVKDPGELFEGRPDYMVMAFGHLMDVVMGWQPGTMGASVHTIIFTNKKAWLIVKPMKKELDIKFYHKEELEHELFKKVTHYNNKYAYHIRVKWEEELTEELFELLRMGYDYGMTS